MILQNVVMQEEPDSGLYYRTKKQYLSGIRVIAAGDLFSTDTYVNAFDVGAWKKYTNVSNLCLKLRVKGVGRVALVWAQSATKSNIIQGQEFNNELNESSSSEEIIFAIPEDISEGIIYFQIHAHEKVILESALYEARNESKRTIKLSVVICTYKRREQLEQLIKVLRQNEEYTKEWLKTKVIDNASELKNQYGENVKVYHNPNNGGSGGFTRGMEEVVHDLEDFSATHVVLMDDDVTLQQESVHRLRALLAYIRDENTADVVAGRMFRLDNPKIQYTASEIWNGGEIRHIGWNQDMTSRERLFDMNVNFGGEYSGWWFSCIPIEFVKENKPLPFFLHCDDVEYGLRHGGTPIILNGIQVWHETYEYRQSPVIAYYDIRNMLLTNQILGINQDKMIILENWLEKISLAHVKREWLLEYMLILGFHDYQRGLNFLVNVDSGKHHLKLCSIRTNRYKNAIAWRMVKRKYMRGK